MKPKVKNHFDKPQGNPVTKKWTLTDLWMQCDISRNVK